MLHTPQTSFLSGINGLIALKLVFYQGAPAIQDNSPLNSTYNIKNLEVLGI